MNVPAKVIRATLANIPAASIVHAAQAAGLHGTAYESAQGFGDWNIEPSVTVETATRDVAGFLSFLQEVMGKHGEQAAYLTVDGREPFLYWQDGRRTDL